MSYDRNSPIHSQGKATAAQIQAWFESRGKEIAPRYAPDKQYKAPPGDLGRIIVEEAKRWPDHAVNHDLLAAQISHESAAYQSEYARHRFNPSGLGAVNDDPDQAIHFPNARAGVRATVAHLLTYTQGPGPWTEYDPRASAVPAQNLGAVKVLADLEQRWAWSPPERYNATPPDQRYGAQIGKLANTLLAVEVVEDEPMPTTVRIALAAGHHNADGGGTAGEYERTGPLTREIARRARQIEGFDIRVITPQDGMGRHDGSLYDAAGMVVAWANEGWKADCFLEVHFEGNGAGNAGRGSFAIFPDWSSDIDVDVRDSLGPLMASAIERLTGLPKRGSGVMSEQQTGVGSQGHRLGVFRATEAVKAFCTRLIYEYGALTAPADKALIDKPAFTERAAQATVEALAGFYGVDAPREPEQKPKDALYLPDNPFGEIPIVSGFRGYVEAAGKARNPEDPIAGALSIFGYPMDAEYPTIDGSAQEFQRCYLKWHSGAKPPWDIVLALRSEGKPEALTV